MPLDRTTTGSPENRARHMGKSISGSHETALAAQRSSDDDDAQDDDSHGVRICIYMGSVNLLIPLSTIRFISLSFSHTRTHIHTH